MYYDKEIQVYVYSDAKDTHGINRKAYTLSTGTILVDIQPYSSEKAKKDYGYNIETTKRLFCDIIPSITESAVIKYNDQYFGIQKIIEWDNDFLECMLLEREDI